MKKNMIHGNKIFLIPFIFLIFSNLLRAEERIKSSPLINIDEIKPSFESVEEKNEIITSNQDLKEKNC